MKQYAVTITVTTKDSITVDVEAESPTKARHLAFERNAKGEYEDVWESQKSQDIEEEYYTEEVA